MSAAKHNRGKRIGRWFNYANNSITIAGIVLTTLSALLIVTFMIVELSGGFHNNPYIGLFAYVVLPVVFVLGLIEIPIGMWRRRRKLLREGASEAELSSFPKLDFNDRRLRKLGAIVLGLTVANAVILGSTSFLAVEKMESVEFCGETCHTVMQPEHTAYQESPHSRVSCVECHIGPGASWFVRSKIDGLRQVWHTALGSYSRPIHTPLRNLRPARETCERCHWPTKHHGDKLRHFARFKTDEHNSPRYTALLLKTGGGRIETGQHGGIHWWHIYSDNKIRFVNSDERKEEIMWVELTRPDGEVRSYSRDGQELPVKNDIEKNAHIMDCIDCHNRPTHLFQTPPKALDAELESYPQLRSLPYFKKTALAAVTQEYETRAEGMAAVVAAVDSFYQESYQEIWSSQRDLVDFASNTAAQVYGRNNFPEMKTDWRSHPNHIGHDDFDGCMRCHDGEMTASDGQYVIPMDCDPCHLFLADESPEPLDLSTVIDS